VDFEYCDVNSIGFSADGRLLVAVGGEGARLYDVVVDRGKDGGLQLHGGAIIGYDWRRDTNCTESPGTTGAKFLGDTNIVLIAHEGSFIEGIDVQEVRIARGSLENIGEPNDVIAKIILPGDGGHVGAFAISPDGHWIANGGPDSFDVINIGDRLRLI